MFIVTVIIIKVSDKWVLFHFAITRLLKLEYLVGAGSKPALPHDPSHIPGGFGTRPYTKRESLRG
jgi:hypothetical protein